MGTGLNWKRLSGVLLLGMAVLCMGSVSPASTTPQTPQHLHKKKTVKKPELPPLPSGPTGPVQPIPLDAIAAVPPEVSYQNNLLTIVASNSTLADILRAVRKQTGAEIEVPVAPERVVTHLGPGPARDVIAELLNGSRFNYVLLGSPANESALTKVVLVAKTGPDTITPPPPTPDPALGITQVNNSSPQDPGADAADADQPDDNAANVDDSAANDQAAQDADQQGNPDQPNVKTPQQMLQEMQQRQLMLQQQQQPGQPPVPGSGMPPHPPQEP